MNPVYPPTNPSYPGNDPRYPPNYSYPPNPYDNYNGYRTPDSYDSALDATTDGSDSDSHHSDLTYDDRHHHAGDDEIKQLPKLQIRRHVPGSNDPHAQSLPAHLDSGMNATLLGPTNVTIKRAPKHPDPVPMQSIPIPVPVIINGPMPRMLGAQSMPFVPPVQFLQPAQYVQPGLPIQRAPFVQTGPLIAPAPVFPPAPPVATKEPVITVNTTKLPEKPASPVKPSLSPRASPTSFRTESVSLPTPKSRRSNISERKPIRMDRITPAPSQPISQRSVPGRTVPKQHDNQQQPPDPNRTKEKVISYRTGEGLSTRELENNSIEDSAEQVYLMPNKTKVVTYRKA